MPSHIAFILYLSLLLPPPLLHPFPLSHLPQFLLLPLFLISTTLSFFFEEYSSQGFIMACSSSYHSLICERGSISKRFLSTACVYMSYVHIETLCHVQEMNLYNFTYNLFCFPFFCIFSSFLKKLRSRSSHHFICFYPPPTPYADQSSLLYSTLTT